MQKFMKKYNRHMGLKIPTLTMLWLTDHQRPKKQKPAGKYTEKYKTRWRQRLGRVHTGFRTVYLGRMGTRMKEDEEKQQKGKRKQKKENAIAIGSHQSLRILRIHPNTHLVQHRGWLFAFLGAEGWSVVCLGKCLLCSRTSQAGNSWVGGTTEKRENRGWGI